MGGEGQGHGLTEIDKNTRYITFIMISPYKLRTVESLKNFDETVNFAWCICYIIIRLLFTTLFNNQLR